TLSFLLLAYANNMVYLFVIDLLFGNTMPRPRKPRHIGCRPPASCFKPNGIPASNLQAETLDADELEALRLADLLQMNQIDAAQCMGVSRQTFGNIVKCARHK